MQSHTRYGLPGGARRDAGARRDPSDARRDDVPPKDDGRLSRTSAHYPGAAPELAPDPGGSCEAGQKQVMRLSARNQIPARVVSIHRGEAIANIELDANGVRLVASITVEAVKQLGLTEGANVTAVIKASDVMVATSD